MQPCQLCSHAGHYVRYADALRHNQGRCTCNDRTNRDMPGPPLAWSVRCSPCTCMDALISCETVFFEGSQYRRDPVFTKQALYVLPACFG